MENDVYDYNIVLNSVKHYCGSLLEEDDTEFDNEFLMAINSSLQSAYQSNDKIKNIEVTSSTTWDELSDDKSIAPLLKTYISIKTKKVFDPSASSVIQKAYDEELNELFFRMSVI